MELLIKMNISNNWLIFKEKYGRWLNRPGYLFSEQIQWKSDWTLVWCWDPLKHQYSKDTKINKLISKGILLLCEIIFKLLTNKYSTIKKFKKINKHRLRKTCNKDRINV